VLFYPVQIQTPDGRPRKRGSNHLVVELFSCPSEGRPEGQNDRRDNSRQRRGRSAGLTSGLGVLCGLALLRELLVGDRLRVPVNLEVVELVGKTP
jgi:hypothetical protein